MRNVQNVPTERPFKSVVTWSFGGILDQTSQGFTVWIKRFAINSTRHHGLFEWYPPPRQNQQVFYTEQFSLKNRNGPVFGCDMGRVQCIKSLIQRSFRKWSSKILWKMKLQETNQIHCPPQIWTKSGTSKFLLSFKYCIFLKRSRRPFSSSADSELALKFAARCFL